MKKIITYIIAAAALMMLPASASAQSTKVHFGFKGGLNINEFSFDDDVFKTDNKVGFFIGPSLTFGLPFMGLGADISALYNQKKMDAGDESIKQQTIDVPVNVRYSIGFSETSCIFVAAGPQVSFAIGDKELTFKNAKDTAEEMNWKLSDSAFSFNVGGGLVMNHLQLGVSYNIPIGKTSEFSWSETTDKVFHADSKSKGWQISAAYYF